MKKRRFKILADNLQVPGQKEVYSKEVRIEEAEYFSVFLKAGGTNPNLKIIREYSWDGKEFVSRDLDGNEDVLTESFTSKEWVLCPENLKYTFYFRYKIKGNSGNSNDATISIIFLYQLK